MSLENWTFQLFPNGSVQGHIGIGWTKMYVFFGDSGGLGTGVSTG